MLGKIIDVSSPTSVFLHITFFCIMKASQKPEFDNQLNITFFHIQQLQNVLASARGSHHLHILDNKEQWQQLFLCLFPLRSL